MGGICFSVVWISAASSISGLLGMDGLLGPFLCLVIRYEERRYLRHHDVVAVASTVPAPAALLIDWERHKRDLIPDIPEH